jgi:alanyl-tRNA synthetase
VVSLCVEVRTHTALHVVKGAIQKVLGAKWTTSVSVNGSHGRISVEFDRKPTDSEITLIEQYANNKIAENLPIMIHNLSRIEAEERWGDIIYDKFSIPEHITELSICQIKDWNINACNKEHTSSTGEIGSVRIMKPRFRAKKSLLEIPFDIK